MASTVVGVLRSMASRGRTILATIHQPSSLVYSLFDRVMFLAEGRVGFLGNTDTALAFFAELLSTRIPRHPCLFYLLYSSEQFE
jgi:ABC-type multidrug transport system ATPase subunit